MCWERPVKTCDFRSVGMLGVAVLLARPLQGRSFVNRLSRLVIDPERFPDEREVMNSVGMGAVYTQTSTGKPLRSENPAHRAELIATRFEPYRRALADLVDDRIAATGRAVILDLHSYPRIRFHTSCTQKMSVRSSVLAPTIAIALPGWSRQRATSLSRWAASRSTDHFAAPTFHCATTGATTV